MGHSLSTPPNMKIIFRMLQKIIGKSFDPEKPRESCEEMAKPIYLILGKISFSDEGHAPFLRKTIGEHRSEARACFGPLEIFFKQAQTHIYLAELGRDPDRNPLDIQTNVLSSLFHLLSESFRVFSKDEREAFHKDGNLRLFEKKDDFYKFMSFLNASRFRGFHRNKFRLCDFNLSGANLSHADLGGTNLQSSDLSGANLSHANLSHADLSGANLTGADLREANLKHAYPKGADLREAKLAEANLSDAVLAYAHMGGANLSSANLTGADLSHTDMYGADLRGANLTGANLTDAHLREADLSVANLVGAYLIRANLICADLTGSNFMDADLTKATLLAANLTDANLTDANLTDANLMDGADLTKAREVSWEQIGKAIVDISTKLPASLRHKA